MDIPLVLERLGLSHLQWGAKANSGDVYEDFLANWPKKNPPAPTKNEMEAAWSQIEADKKPRKTKEEIKSELDSRNLTGLMNKELIHALVADLLERNPNALIEFGIPVSGEK